jgi:hypothetical protein
VRGKLVKVLPGNRAVGLLAVYLPNPIWQGLQQWKSTSASVVVFSHLEAIEPALPLQDSSKGASKKDVLYEWQTCGFVGCKLHPSVDGEFHIELECTDENVPPLIISAAHSTSPRLQCGVHATQVDSESPPDADPFALSTLFHRLPSHLGTDVHRPEGHAADDRLVEYACAQDNHMCALPEVCSIVYTELLLLTIPVC